MANVLIKPDVAVARAKMRQIYANAERDIITEITRKRAMEYVDYAEVASLERVQAILTDMQEKAGDYIPQYIEKIFYSATEKDAAGYKNARVLTSTQTNIEQQLVNNLMGSLMEASAVAFESAKRELTIGRLVEGEIREAQLTSILNQKAAGLSWRTASKNMKIDLQQKGITSFVDKAGREWSLTDYCDMCSRTTARQAEVAAALTADDWDLWQISSIGSTCKLCATYEGRVYSKSGLNPDYPPLSAAFGKIDVSGGNDLANTYLNIHPNCLHSLVKYTTMGKTEEQIQRDKDFSSFKKRPANEDYRSRKQRDAYRQKEANRAKLLSDRNQWQRYQTALGKDIPGFEAFRKNKLNGTEKFKKWESEYRSLTSKSGKVDKLLERAIIGAEENTDLSRYIGQPIAKSDNKTVREWYWANVHNIPNMVDTEGPLYDRAVKAYSLRNDFKRQARRAMLDEKAAEFLEQKYPVKDFDTLLHDKMKRKGLSEEEAYTDIIRSSATTNPDFDKEFGL